MSMRHGPLMSLTTIINGRRAPGALRSVRHNERREVRVRIIGRSGGRLPPAQECNPAIHVVALPPSATGPANTGVAAAWTALSYNAARAQIGASTNSSSGMHWKPASVSRVYQCLLGN